MENSKKGDMTSLLQPTGWPRARGYSQGVAASGLHVFISGQIGWNEQFEFESDDFVDQSGLALQNILSILTLAGGEPEHVTRLVWYVVSKTEYLGCQKRLGPVYRAVMGDHYPTMTAVQVVALMEDRARVEIEATAIVPIPPVTSR